MPFLRLFDYFILASWLISELSDLLQAHLRRHESRKDESLEEPPEANPLSPRQNHWENSVGRAKRTNAGWDSAARPFAPPGGIDFGSSLPALPVHGGGQDLIAEAEPPGFPLERVIFGARSGHTSQSQDHMLPGPDLLFDEYNLTDSNSQPLITDEYYFNLLGEVGVRPLTQTFSYPRI